MSQNKTFKINDSDDDNFIFNKENKTNKWLKRPWYFLILILVVVLVGGFLLYAQAQKNNNKIITDNQSQKPKVFESEVSGTNYLDQSSFEDELVNILLLGTGGPGHPGGGLTDVIQVLSINPKKEQALIFSIPRDLYVNVDGFGWHKINTAYNLGQSQGHGQGGVLAKKEVEQVTGIPIHYYIKVNFDGFAQLIEILNGIDVCVDKGISDNFQNMHVSQGCQTMSGEKALDYVRSRYTTSDFDRSARQQKVLLAIKNKALKLDFILNPFKLKRSLSVLSGNLNTDIKISESGQLGKILSVLNKDKIDSYVLDNRKDNLLFSTSKHGAYVLLPSSGDFKQIRKFVKNKLPK